MNLVVQIRMMRPNEFVAAQWLAEECGTLGAVALASGAQGGCKVTSM